MDTNKLSPMMTLQGGKVVYTGDAEEPYPSLSDYHDYEPNLEFDDSELHQTPTEVAEAIDLLQEMDPDEIASPVSEFIDDNFEAELADNTDINFQSMLSSYPEVGEAVEKFMMIDKCGIVDVKGDDSVGRKIIVVYACKLPQVNKIDHQKFLEYLIYTLDKYVEQDYSLVYFHYGLNSRNKPSIRWLWQAYRAFDRKYKKNLKALYMVHPTSFLKIILQMFTPVISVKFGKKLSYINTLAELSEHINLEQLSIPEEVTEHDKKLSKNTETNRRTGENPTAVLVPLPTRQFGVSLATIKQNYKSVIPPVIKQTIDYLDHPDVLETEGLFRRSASTVKIRALREDADQGKVLEFDDPHEATVLMKLFFRELKEPLLTFDFYEEVMNFQQISKDMQLRHVSILVMEKLPEDNYKILKYVTGFLSKVMERADLNKMTASNLAVCFGPNLVWSENKNLSIAAIGHINTFTQFLLQHNREIFMI
ncbi:PREDICTED: rho GTPase-activating protein 1-like isoform X1 [Nicrophorus vespilloides]|uniref:Rho GTPase-activating protein 1-like isoform X1 n=1 Tax=Nicrophorus vespilloides TaxID=110193 RepID=A0ABM1MK68_NICVS|nr:PREDICTED: rho GTPase-activating protein 1-like isoform X1 [Nicrophorus vespilloides]